MTRTDSAENSLKIKQSFLVTLNKLENLPDQGTFVAIVLNVVLYISLIVVQYLPDNMKQMLAALKMCHWVSLKVKSTLSFPKGLTKQSV